MDRIRHNQSPIDIFLQAFNAATKEQQPEAQEAAYKSLGRAHPEGLEPINRRVLRDLHPDKPENRERMNTAGFKEKLDGLRNGYTKGRDHYLTARPSDQVDALKKNDLPSVALDANQMADLSTRFHYDASVQYHPSMGDLFYHPQKDRMWRTSDRTVPADLEFRNREVSDGFGGEKEMTVPAGFIHAHFREYQVEHPAAREQFIALCLKATQQELFDIDGVREQAEAVLIEQGGDIATMRGLIDACEDMHKREYLKSWGVWGGTDDPKVKQRVDDFLTSASIPELYQLTPFILPACIEHSDLSAAEILQRAKEAHRRHDAGDVNHIFGTPPSFDEDLENEGPVVDDSSKRDDLFSGMGHWS